MDRIRQAVAPLLAVAEFAVLYNRANTAFYIDHFFVAIENESVEFDVIVTTYLEALLFVDDDVTRVASEFDYA